MKAGSKLQSILSSRNLPPLPKVVRYYDDFSDSYEELKGLADSDRWTITFDGRRATLDLGKFEPEIRGLIERWCAISLSVLAPPTVVGYYYGLRRLAPDQLIAAVQCRPTEIRSYWKTLHSELVSYKSLQALENLLSFCCDFRIGFWAPDWQDLVSQLPLPKRDKYASVRIGEVFLGIAQEAMVVKHIDQICQTVQTQPDSVSDESLEATAILVCSYQFAFRPKQIAMLEMRNIGIWDDGIQEGYAVHLTFTMIKQRDSKQVFPMVRRVKRDWAPLFVELYRRAERACLSGADHVFRRTPDEVSILLADLAEAILEDRRTGTEFRHTAAQRFVDAGANREELAWFLGHSDLGTGQIYYRSSPSQGERVNQALGLSAVYQQVVNIAHDRFISRDELALLKGEKQVAGIPHGIPIAGIGGCTTGQPNCPYNPVSSCYGCSRFMPLADAGVHKQVLEDLRGVLKFFYISSRAERGSPAFQLQQTIQKVQALIDEIGEEKNELLP